MMSIFIILIGLSFYDVFNKGYIEDPTFRGNKLNNKIYRIVLFLHILGFFNLSGNHYLFYSCYVSFIIVFQINKQLTYKHFK